MNKNLGKPTPSPITTACRKPLLNITNLVNTPQSAMLNKQKQIMSRPESTKSIKQRISIDEFSRPKLKQVHSRRSNRSDSQDSSSSSQVAQKHCRNHKNRIAMHQIDSTTAEYLCLECSLVYAKQGFKIKSLNHHNNDKANRQKQTSEYLQKCSHIHNQLMRWRKQQNKVVKQIFQQFGELINNHKIKMEEQINKVRQNYQHQIKSLQTNRQQKMKKFKDIDNEVQKISKVLESTRVDIQRNYDDCIKSFNNKEYRFIMDQYWKQVHQAETFLTENPIKNLIKQSEVDIKMTVRTMGRSQNIGNEFTFSKQKKFQTPPFSKQLRGIKVVQSQSDSNRYESSLKESVVDSKINFSEFNI